MAPPSPRRPGFSRRAQYGIFASYVIAVVGAAAALLLVLTARFDPEGHSALQALAADATAPVSDAARSMLAGFGGIGTTVSDYIAAGSKNRAMAQDIAALRRTEIEANRLRVENARLKALIGIQDAKIRPIAAAALISSTGASSRRYATLAAGADAGIGNGQPVVGPEGLVGRIVATGRRSARVLLIVDAANVTPVKRVSDGAPALAIGNGDGRLTLRPLSSVARQIQSGDVFVTSGSGGIYRPGIPVAKAIDNGREGTLARPMADPDGFDYALVEPIYQAPPPAAPAALPDGEKK
ncbi:MAG: rod shape-determining protein MreC [Pseudomonadota bacterium]|jgi:rod shape-determining protein MreC